MIIQVDVLVTELCRITVLWDELWLGSLVSLNNTATEKIKSLSAEVCYHRVYSYSLYLINLINVLLMVLSITLFIKFIVVYYYYYVR